MAAERNEQSDRMWVEQVSAERVAFLTGLVEYGALTLKSLILLHGGALVALIALSGNIYERAKGSAFSAFQATMTGAAGWFTAGLIMAVGATGFGYFNFLANTHLNAPGELRRWYRGSPMEQPPLPARAVPLTMWLGIGTAILSLGFFIMGATETRSALKSLPPSGSSGWGFSIEITRN